MNRFYFGILTSIEPKRVPKVSLFRLTKKFTSAKFRHDGQFSVNARKLPDFWHTLIFNFIYATIPGK